MAFESVTIWGSFFGGIVSFLSPCALPLLPSLITFFEVKDQTGKMNVKKLFAFWGGFTLVFLSMGSAASLIGQLFFRYHDWLTKMGGIFVILMGLFLVGFGSKSILQKEVRPFLGKSFHGYFGAFLFGIAFTVGWTPCSGPILASVLTIAGVENSLDGILLMAAYSAGFGVPFLLLTLFFDRFFHHIKRIARYLPLIQKVSGCFLIGIGILIYLNLLSRWILQVSF